MHKVFIIAEAGVNHNGEIETALRMCEEAHKAGADAVKFQTFKTDAILIRETEMASYQKKNLGTDISQYEMIKKLELSYSDFNKIKSYCDGIGICFLSTPDEKESLDFLVSLGVSPIKIGSAEVQNIPFLRQIGKTGTDLVLSTGMSSLGDVERAVVELKHAGAGNITLLQCTTNYPCPYQEVNLKAIKTLQEAFHFPVGFSDHTQGIEASLGAVALGACILEKHFTLDKRMEGPDHKASLDPEEFRNFVSSVRRMEACLGTGLKYPFESEKKIRTAATRSLVALKDISKGQTYTEENVTVKRTGNKGFNALLWDQLIGRESDRNYCKDEPITGYLQKGSSL